MLPRVSFVCLISFVCVAIVKADSSDQVDPPPAIDVKSQSKALISKVRGLVTKAKEGTSVDRLQKNVLDLQNLTSSLLQQLPGEVSECDTQTIIKMAAAATRSHEVMQVLLANDAVTLLGARLGLCLATMSEIAQEFEGQVTLSPDVGPYLAALLFTSNTTLNVIKTADKAVKDISLPPGSSRLQVNRPRRQINLGGGWGLGRDGLTWRSQNRNTQFNIKPTFNGIIPNGVSAGFSFKF